MTPSTSTNDSTPLSVLLCADHDTARRLGPMIRRLAIGLLDQAVEVRLLAIGDGLAEMATGSLEVIHHHPAPWPFNRMELRRVLDALSERPPTILHALSPSVSEVAKTIADLVNSDLVVQLSSEEDCRLGARLGVPVEAWIASSSQQKDIAINHYRFPEHLIEVVHPGVPVSSSIACFADDDQIPTLLCTSPFIPDSGVDRLLAALLALKGRDTSPLLFLWGKGPSESALRAYVRLHQLDAQVIFARPLGETSDAMTGADAFVYCESQRAISMDVLQAMGRGLAVVCPAQIGCDSVQPGSTTFAFDPTSVQSMADVLSGVLSDRTAAREMAQRAMNHVRSHHTVSGMAEQVARLYHRLMSKHATIRLKE